MKETVATYKDDDGRLQEVPAPEWSFDVDDRFIIEGDIDLWLDGELQSVYVDCIDVVSKTRELDVEARDWCINYKVEIYGPNGETIKRESLDEFGLEEMREKLQR